MRKAMGIAAVCAALGACMSIPNEVSPSLNGLSGVTVAPGPQNYPVIKAITFQKQPLASTDTLVLCIKQTAELVLAEPVVTADRVTASGRLSYPIHYQGFHAQMRYSLVVSPGAGSYRFERISYEKEGGELAAVAHAAPENAYAKFQELADQIDRCAR